MVRSHTNGVMAAPLLYDQASGIAYKHSMHQASNSVQDTANCPALHKVLVQSLIQHTRRAILHPPEQLLPWAGLERKLERYIWECHLQGTSGLRS